MQPCQCKIGLSTPETHISELSTFDALCISPHLHFALTFMEGAKGKHWSSWKAPLS